MFVVLQPEKHALSLAFSRTYLPDMFQSACYFMLCIRGVLMNTQFLRSSIVPSYAMGTRLLLQFCYKNIEHLFCAVGIHFDSFQNYSEEYCAMIICSISLNSLFLD